MNQERESKQMDKRMKSICIIIPYLGKWPRWFSIYLETCRYNPTINWLFFTDCSAPKGINQNIKFLKMDLRDFNSLASKKLGLKVNLKNNYIYKVVDFKPAYGIIFEDYLNKYDFWGYSDLDVIYGDIRKFVTSDMLETYDVITAKKEYLVGHFTLYKNCDKINKLYQKTRDYKRVFIHTEKRYNFCECSKDWSNLGQGGSIFAKRSIKENVPYLIKYGMNRAFELFRWGGHFWLTREVESMTECVKRLGKEGYLKSFFKTIGTEDFMKLEKEGNWKVYWNKGELTDTQSGDEFMYFHLLCLKRKKQFIIPQWHKIPENFFITKEGFFEGQE